MCINTNVITFRVLVVCNEIFHKRYLYQDMLILKISYKLTKNFLSYEVW